MSPLLPAARLLRLVVVWAGVLFGSLATAESEAPKTSFDVAGGAAAETLRQLSRQARESVVFPIDRVRGVRTSPVRGEFTAREAAERMVAGTELFVSQDPQTGALLIARQALPEPLPADPHKIQFPTSSMNTTNPRNHRTGPFDLLASLAGIFLIPLIASEGRGAAATNAPQPLEEAVVMSIFEVTEEKDEGYRSTQTVAGTRTLENLRDTPNSISIVNRELIEDVGALTMQELSTFMITGEVEENVETQRTSYSFRGREGTQLRNGIFWLLPNDTFSLERVEVLRGPSAFLYGEGNPGGALNQVTKQAIRRDFQRGTFVTGSHDLRRFELDLNRKLTSTLALRLATAYQEGGGSINHTSREFKGVYLSANYRPFRGTNINLNFEAGRNHEVRASGIRNDAYTTTDQLGTSAAYSQTTGGQTFLPGIDLIYNTVGQRRSTGTGLAVTDRSVLPEELNFLGPESYFRQHYDSLQLTMDQKVGENFNLQANMILQNSDRYLWVRAGSSSGGVYRDINATLPGGAPNPNFGRLYTESYNRKRLMAEPQANWRLTAVYDLDLSITKQRLIAIAGYHKSNPNQQYYSEFVDPSSSSFLGSLQDGNTLQVYRANRTAMQRNFFYRRYYIEDGDGEHLTGRTVVEGRSVIMRDIVADGADGHQTERDWYSPSYGVGASGSYLKGRLRSLVGWRHDSFIQSPTLDYYNQVTRETFLLSDGPQLAESRIHKASYNYGLVANFWPMVGAYFNYAQSVNVSNGYGGAGLTPGTVRGLQVGDGYEAGLRWSFLGGRLETNWTYYLTTSYNSNSNPSISAAVRSELAAHFAQIESNGIDTQSMEATGVEVEAVANLRRNWRLTWNFSTNDMKTADRFPQLRSYREQGKGEGIAMPETDAFLASVPDGTPLPGFMRIRSNLVTNYTFEKGPLAGVSVGGSLQFRDRGYRGEYDQNRDGAAESIWSPRYLLGNAALGYRTKIANRPVDLRLNVNNLGEKIYYRASSLGGGMWGAGREFRLTMRVDL